MKSRQIDHRLKGCGICYEEQLGNFEKGADIVCPTCILRLTSTPKDRIGEAIKLLREKGGEERASLLEIFTREEVEHHAFRKKGKAKRGYKRRVTYRRRTKHAS